MAVTFLLYKNINRDLFFNLINTTQQQAFSFSPSLFFSLLIQSQRDIKRAISGWKTFKNCVPKQTSQITACKQAEVTANMNLINAFVIIYIYIIKKKIIKLKTNSFSKHREWKQNREKERANGNAKRSMGNDAK